MMTQEAIAALKRNIKEIFEAEGVVVAIIAWAIVVTILFIIGLVVLKLIY